MWSDDILLYPFSIRWAVDNHRQPQKAIKYNRQNHGRQNHLKNDSVDIKNMKLFDLNCLVLQPRHPSFAQKYIIKSITTCVFFVK